MHVSRAIVMVALTLAAAASAQSPPDLRNLPVESFEAISIRPNTSGTRGGGMQPSGRLSLQGTTLAQLLIFGFDGVIIPERMIGVPDWAQRDRFDIVATPRSATQDHGGLFRGLLRDRFNLRWHVEARTVPVYLMTVARADGQTGGGLRPQALDCTDDEVFRRAREQAGGSGSACGSVAGRDQLRMRSATLDTLATVLASRLGQPVVNRTGITGRVDIDMTWDPNLNTAADQPGDRAGLFTAVQEQLGLRLQSERAPIEMLVIDNVSRPTAN